MTAEDGSRPEPAHDEPAHGWRAVAAEAMGSGEHLGLLATTWMLLTSPVTNAVAMADDPKFKGHFKFFSMCFALWLGFLLVAGPQFASWYTGDEMPTVDAKYVSAALTILEYLEIAITVVVGFFIYRLGATRTHSPLSFYKFALLCAGLLLLLSIVLQSLRLAGIIAIQELFDDDRATAIVENPTLIAAVNVALVVASIAALIALNRAYWGLRWRFVVPATVLLMAINIAAVAAGLQVLELEPVRAMIKSIF